MSHTGPTCPYQGKEIENRYFLCGMLLQTIKTVLNVSCIAVSKSFFGASYRESEIICLFYCFGIYIIVFSTHVLNTLFMDGI
jgi:hypothetical protein